MATLLFLFLVNHQVTFYYHYLIFSAPRFSLSLSSSRPIFAVIKLILPFVSLPLSVLQPGLAALLVRAFHRQLSQPGYFAFSGRGRCVYPAQILDLFITAVDLGSAQGSSPWHQAAVSADRPGEDFGPSLFIDSEQAVAQTVLTVTVTQSLYQALWGLWDWTTAVKVIEGFIIKLPLWVSKLWRPMHKYKCKHGL